MEGLEKRLLQTLEAGYEADTALETDRHALQMQRSIRDNRRGLRKFLTAYWRGERDYIRKHPQTQQWLQRHSGLDLHLWQNGLSGVDDGSTADEIRIAVEQDPLEALKLGTYVGSCLGLGGLCDYSAAAAVLDFNKQVLYARNHKGSIVARQLIAVSEEDQLVCFEVYPNSVSPQIKRRFLEYDRRMAEALRLQLYMEGRPAKYGEENYRIAHILSESWWDDSPWDFNLEPDS